MQLHHHQQYVIEEFAEEYQARRLARRDLLKRVLMVTGSIPTTASVLFALGCGDSADDEDLPPEPTVPPVSTTAAGVGPNIVMETDPAIKFENLRIPGPASELLGYLARPAAPGTYPGIVIIHENQGMIDHFKDLARRFAKEGFVGLAVDLISRNGGTTTDLMRNMMAQRQSREDFLADLLAYTAYLKAQTAYVKPNALGTVGFCFGGDFAFELAVASPDIKAAVPFYGTASQQVFDGLNQMRAPAYVVYGETDRRVTAQQPEVEEKLRAAGRTFEIKIYPGVGHAFFNPGRPSYNEAVASEAWTHTLAWFRKYLTA
jgi:carboxymethylenebutenolidase